MDVESIMNNENDENNTDEITLSIKNFNSDTMPFTVRKDMTIGEFKMKYIEATHPDENARLLFNFNGKKLDEKKTFKDYDIKDGDMIHALIRLSGGY